jgi:regulator of sigma E protease
MKNLTYGLAADSLATNVGVQDGDMITAVNNKPLAYYDDLPKELMLNERPVLTINRNGKDTAVLLPAGFISSLTKSKLKGFVSPRFPTFVDSVSADVTYTSGQLRKGDRIIGINDQPALYFTDFEKAKQAYKNQPVTLKIVRNGSDTVRVGVKIKENASVGFFPKSPIKLFNTEKRQYAFAEAIPAGTRYGVERLKEYVTGIGLLFTSKEHKLKDNLGSVLSIGKTFGDSWDWQHFWTMTALFSIILAFMNILPIPALDGGHALFTLYEMVTARKPSDKFMEYAQMAGMVLLMGLMLYAFGLDIWRLMK